MSAGSESLLPKLGASLKTLLLRANGPTPPPADEQYFTIAQYRAFTQQMPMMYVMLLTSMWSVAVVYYAQAPLTHALIFPAIMTAASANRIHHWWIKRHTEPTIEMANRAARKTRVLAALMAGGFVGWVVVLFPYGDPYSQSLLAFFLTTASMTCVFCLMHNRRAAYIVFLAASAGFIVHFGTTGVTAFVAASIIMTAMSIGLLVMIQINHRDFTRMIEAQIRTQALSDENFRLANLDTLSDLPNRRAFFAELENRVKAAAASGSSLALGVIDLDGFKPINDLYGHPFGDRLLTEVSRRLAQLCQEDGNYIARLGGDEFALIVPDIQGDDRLLSIGEKLCDALRAPFELSEASVHIAGSIGFAVYPGLAKTPAELFEHADYALYDGKHGDRRGQPTLFTAQHIAAIYRDARIEQALKMADLDAELELVFQPIVDVASTRTVAFEALARWTSPTLGKVSSGQFIPVAERAGFINRLTRPLLTKALAAARSWPTDIRLSFNLSAYDLSSSESMLAIIRIIEESGFDPSRLDLEVTETAFGHDFDQVRKATKMLQYLGCGISLDDFGTGYSSLSRLHALPLTKIKIDRSFVIGLHRNQIGAKIVKSLLALSRDMGLDCIVEGVETEEEMAALRKLGGTMVQGYFYSPPVSGAELNNFLGPQLRQAS
jgi:diguanylate cyclase (GGDEF)-like protein